MPQAVTGPHPNQGRQLSLSEFHPTPQVIEVGEGAFVSFVDDPAHGIVTEPLEHGKGL